MVQRIAAPIPVGPFTLHTRIGQGGMGEVWKGIHRGQNVPVAMKVITREKARHPTWQASFRNEVRATARMDHPGIVMVLDFGEIDATAEAASGGALVAGSPYIIMEWASGGSLESVRLPLPWQQLRVILLALLDALSHAHARGLLHRDLKPGNILLARSDDQRPGIKISDFGIACPLDGRDDWSGVEGPAGTPSFMAPEQFGGQWRDYGPWTDLYALGCVTWELATGQPAFPGTHYLDLASAKLTTPTPIIPRIEAYPAGFRGWMYRLMAREIRDRFQCAADAIWALIQLDPSTWSQLPELPISLGWVRGQTPGAECTTLFATDTTLLSSGRSLPDADTWEPRPSLRSASIDRKDAEDSFRATAPRPKAPPMPPAWRRPLPIPHPVPLIGAGLGLFGLYQVGLVGREEHRDAIWTALCQVREQKMARAVVLRGPAGFGKSRLAEWIGERAIEVGAAQVLKAVHNPTPGPSDGLGRMMARQFHCIGLNHSHTVLRLERLLRDLGVTDDYQWHALATLIIPPTEKETAAGARAIQFEHPAERYALIREHLAHMAVERPVILWLDDVQWGEDALRLATYLMQTREQLPTPILLLLTVRDEALAEQPVTASQLEALLAFECTHPVHVGPLSSAESSTLLRSLLYLDSDLSHQIQARSGGNPLFAIHLVGDWVQRGYFTLGREGFELQPGAETVLPDDLHMFWTRRIDRFLDGMAALTSATDAALGRDIIEASLELAAILGQTVDQGEWWQACDEEGIPKPVHLVDELQANRLAYSTECGWAFVHGMVRESLELRARERGRWMVHHRSCARMLRDRRDDEQRGVAERLGLHLLAIGEVEQALQPLLDGARERREQGDCRSALQLLEKREQAMSHLPQAGLEIQRLNGWLILSDVHQELTEFEQSHEWICRAMGEAIHCNSPNHVGYFQIHLGNYHVWKDDMQQAEACYQRALEQCSLHSDPGLHGHCLLGLAGVHSRTQQYARACQLYSDALLVYRSTGREDGEMQCLLGLAEVSLDQRQYDHALDITRKVIDYVERHAHGKICVRTWNLLGEIYRFRHELQLAEEAYSNACETAGSLGMTMGACVPRLNICYLMLAGERYDEARAVLTTMLSREDVRRMEFMWGVLHCPLLVTLAHARDWLAWDRSADLIAEHLSRPGMVDHDPAWCLQLAAEISFRAGEHERASKAYHLAGVLWARMERADKIEEITQALTLCLERIQGNGIVTNNAD